MTNLPFALNQLEQAELVRRLLEAEPAYQFKHALAQETANYALLNRTRRELHRQVADAYVRLYAGNLDEIAALLSEHYWLAEAWAPAAEYALRAGDVAMRNYALPVALTHYARSLQALEKTNAAPEAQIDATLGWIRPAIHLEPFDRVLDRLRQIETQARVLGDKRRLALVLHWIANVQMTNGYTSRAFPALVENHRLAAEVGDEYLSIVPNFWLAFAMVDRDPQGAVPQFDQVIELARKYHNPEMEAYALGTRALANARLGRYAEARGDQQQALGILGSFSSPMGQADVNNLSGFTLLELGDLERARERLERGSQAAHEHHVLECESAGLMGLGMCQMRTREFGAAEETLHQSIQVANLAGSDMIRNQASAVLAATRYLRGEPDAIAAMETTLPNVRALGDETSAAYLAHLLAEAYLAVNPANAEEYLNDAIEFYRRTDMRPYLARTLQTAARLYELQGRPDAAAAARAEADQLTLALDNRSLPTAV